MRERLVVWFVAVALVTLVVFGVVRAYSLDAIIQRYEQVRVDRTASLVSVVLADQVRAGEPVTAADLRSLVGPDERIRYVDEAGRVTTVRASGFDLPAGVTANRHVAGGGAVSVARSRSVVDAAVSDALLPLVLVAVVLAAVAALLGFLVARWLSGPFRELARAARSLGRGRFDVQVPRFAIPEADVVGQALETSAGQLRDLMAHERQFVLSASHELNTPVTALRLELEELSLDPDLPPSAHDGLQRAMADLDRLHGAVASLLTVARGQHLAGAEDVDVAALAAEAADRWRARSGRVIVCSATGPVLLTLSPGAVEQTLDALLGSLTAAGHGTVRVDVDDRDDHVVVRVRDDSPEAARELPAAALAVVDALGGHLGLDRAATTSYTLRLPRAPRRDTPVDTPASAPVNPR